jgi:hypothetical protein
MKIGDLVFDCEGRMGVITDTLQRCYIDSFWIMWCDGANPEWCDEEELMLYEEEDAI